RWRVRPLPTNPKYPAPQEANVSCLSGRRAQWGLHTEQPLRGRPPLQPSVNGRCPWHLRRSLSWKDFENLLCGDFQNFTFLIESAMGTGAMRQPLFVTIRTLG